MKPLCGVVIAALLVSGCPAQAADWPQRRGPARDGRSDEKNLLDQWPAAGPKLVWKAELSPGGASPVLAGKHVYCAAMEKGQAVLVCFDRERGLRQWAVPFGPQGKGPTTLRQGPYSTPTVDGDRVYVMTSGGRVACIATTTKSVLWAHDCKDIDCISAGWGTSSSFLIVGDVALVNMIAFDKLKGTVLWKNSVETSGKRAGKIDHASPLLVTIDGTQQVVFHARGGVVAVDPLTGKDVWFVKGASEEPEWNVVFTPVWTGEYLLATARTKKYGSPLVALRLGKSAGADGYRVAAEFKDFKEPSNGCQMSSPVVDGQWLFGVVTDVGRPTLLCCSLKDGKTCWEKEAIPNRTWTSPILADGKVYLHLGDGNLVMFRPTGASYQELGRAKICGETSASPALADGRLYVRDETALWCLDVAKPR